MKKFRVEKYMALGHRALEIKYRLLDSKGRVIVNDFPFKYAKKYLES